MEGFAIRQINVLLPERDKERFLKSAKENNSNHVELIISWIDDYVEKHEEDLVAKKLHKEADLFQSNKKGDLLN